MKKQISSSQKALNLWAVILIVWSFYRAYFKLPEWFDEFIAKPLVFILPVFFYIKKVEKGNFFKGINFSFKTRLGEYLIGIGIGSIFLLMAILANLLKLKKINFLAGHPVSPQAILLIVATVLATAISEEILSRGFILKRLYEESKNIYSSSFFASFLFFFLHVPIIFTSMKITGSLIVFVMVTDLLLSLTTSFLFLTRKNLVVPILIHAFYNLTIYFFA